MRFVPSFVHTTVVAGEVVDIQFRVNCPDVTTHPRNVTMGTAVEQSQIV